MHTHARAKLGPAGRFALTEAIANGMSHKAAAAALCVAPATAQRWWHRRLAASEQGLRSGSWLFDRSSRPCHSPRPLDTELQERAFCLVLRVSVGRIGAADASLKLPCGAECWRCGSGSVLSRPHASSLRRKSQRLEHLIPVVLAEHEFCFGDLPFRPLYVCDEACVVPAHIWSHELPGDFR